MSQYRIPIIAVFAALSTTAYALPVNNDLWEHTNSGFSILSLSAPTVCGDIRNIFGATLTGPTDSTTSCPAENAAGNTVLSDISSLATTVEWTTAMMNLSSFELNVAPDNAVFRVLDRLQIAYWDGAGFVPFYDSGSGAYPFPTISFPVTLATAVQSDRWRATFTNTSTTSFPGARVVELDGFGSLVNTSGVPEPSSFGLIVVGLGALVTRLRRQ